MPPKYGSEIFVKGVDHALLPLSPDECLATAAHSGNEDGRTIQLPMRIMVMMLMVMMVGAQSSR